MSLLGSSKGVVSLLFENDAKIVTFALKRLLSLTDVFWFEISPELWRLEELYESDDFMPLKSRQLAALVISRVYFHLGEYEDSVTFALSAGTLFDPTERSLYSDTIMNRCIDIYVQGREKANDLIRIDSRLEKLVEQLAGSWSLNKIEDVEIKNYIGFMIRARRIDILKDLLLRKADNENFANLIQFSFKIARETVQDIEYRHTLMRMLCDLPTNSVQAFDDFSKTHCLITLNDYKTVAHLLYKLYNSKKERIVALQLAFDLYDYATQDFLMSVIEILRGFFTESDTKELGNDEVEIVYLPEPSSGNSQTVDPTSVIPPKLLSILYGECTASFHVRFLYACCNADIHIMNQLKKCIYSRNTLLHNAVIFANSLMYAGTTISVFLTENLEWLSKSSQWGKFTMTATLGVIYRGQISESMKILQDYLPSGSSVNSLGFQQGGAMYALGLMHSPVSVSKSTAVTEYLKEALSTYADNPRIVYGASLGIGLASMGSRDESLADRLLAFVAGGDSVTSEGITVSYGLVMLGNRNPLGILSLKNIACEVNQREKVIRGACMAMAFMNLGAEEESLNLVEEMLVHSNLFIRVGACFILGLAYASTCNITSIRQLLSITVKDTADDVKRNALIMLGFVVASNPDLCLELIKTLVGSYNPHIRYGVCIAIGVSASGSGHTECIKFLWRLLSDRVDFVRQGAFIALSLVMVQLSEKENDKVAEFRALLLTKISCSKTDVCTKFGCILATGLLDAGGRNCTFALNRQGQRCDKAVVGLFMFTQYWYWFPYIPLISLAMYPTCIIGLNEDLEMPKYSMRSNAPPSKFAYPKSLLVQKREEKKNLSSIQQVVLSTARKEQEFRKLQSTQSLEVKSTEGKDGNNSPSQGDLVDTLVSAKEDTIVSDEKNKNNDLNNNQLPVEENFTTLNNPARVTYHQLAVMNHTVDDRYVPLKSQPFGICMLRDTKPENGSPDLISKIDVIPETSNVSPPEAFSWP